MMTTQEVKEYLNRAYYIDRRIESLQDELNQIESRLRSVTPSYGSTHTESQSSFEYVLDRLYAYRERLNREVDNLIDTKSEIKSTIENTLDDETQRLVLTKRYLNYQKYDGIAKDLNYSTRQVINIANKGIKNISLNFTKKV